MALTLIVSVTWTNGRRSRGYLKCFKRDHRKGVANEVTAYILARECGLPIPAHAAVIELPPQFLAQDGDLYEWGFIVSEVGGKTPKTIFNIGSAVTQPVVSAVADILRAWSKLSDAIAFDDWTANIDRNLGNFIVAGPGKIFLIDHSNLPVGIAWQPAQLNPSGDYLNLFLLFLGGPEVQSLPMKSSIVSASAKHKQALQNCQGALTAWWQLLLDAAECQKAIHDFIAIRADSGHVRLTTKLQLVA